MTKLSEKYRAIADLYAYLESRPSDSERTAGYELIEDILEIADSLYHELSASPASSQLLAAVEAHGIEVHRYGEDGCYVYDLDAEFCE